MRAAEHNLGLAHIEQIGLLATNYECTYELIRVTTTTC